MKEYKTGNMPKNSVFFGIRANLSQRHTILIDLYQIDFILKLKNIDFSDNRGPLSSKDPDNHQNLYL